MANIHKVLSALADMGAAEEVFFTLLEMAGERELSLEQKRYLCGPLVVHSSNGGTCWPLPDWVPAQVKAERAEIVSSEIMGGAIAWSVGPTEIMAVMHDAALCAPLRDDHASLYLGIFPCCRQMEKSVL